MKIITHNEGASKSIRHVFLGDPTWNHVSDVVCLSDHIVQQRFAGFHRTV